MSKYLIQGDSLISIANEVRELLGSTEAMDIETMKAKLREVQENITQAFVAIGEKKGQLPDKLISSNLASAIDTISSDGLYANMLNWQKTAVEYEYANIVNWQKTVQEYEPAVFIRNVELEVSNETQN